MASPAALTTSYRLAQGRIATRTSSLAMLAFEHVLDTARLDATFPAYVSTVLPILNGGRAQAATLAAAYYEEHRAESGVTGQAPVPAVPGPISLDQASTSLLYTGPITLRRQLARGNTLITALNVARALTGAALFRHTANAGRGLIFETSQRDTKSLGYARVTDGKPCYFCAMLASRGAVYKSRDTAGAGPRGAANRYHDGCGCTVQAIYGTDAQIPGSSAKYDALWREVTGEVSGHDKVLAFRAAYEASL